jgi:hypothetical protein
LICEDGEKACRASVQQLPKHSIYPPVNALGSTYYCLGQQEQYYLEFVDTSRGPDSISNDRMTTFTKIQEGEQQELHVSPSRKLNRINKNIYGGFTEHMGMESL